MDPMTPGGKPPTAETLVSEIGKAEQDGRFQKLKELMDEEGWDEDPGSLLMLAQKDDRTKAKSPDELADMMRADPSIYDDLLAYKPGGALEKLAKGGESEGGEPKGAKVEIEVETGGESGGESEPMDDEIGSMLEKSSSMKGESVDKARGAMKSAGFKPGKDDMDYAKKKRFMSAMADE